jgi:hypothetical protein
MIVGKIENFTVSRRKLPEATPDNGPAIVFFRKGLRVVCGITDSRPHFVAVLFSCTA